MSQPVGQAILSPVIPEIAKQAATGAAGKPIGPDPSGFRIAQVAGSGIQHMFFGPGLLSNLLPDLTK